MFDKIKNVFKKKEEPKPKQRKSKKSEKDIATDKKEPWVNVLQVELDPENPGNGSFELDWNDYFVAKLVKSGYQGKTDEDIVDNWFQDVCRHVVLETYQQYDANNAGDRVNKKDLGGGRTEYN
jgi:hypothetical protein